LVVLGTFLRFWALDRQSLWNDEMFSLSRASASVAELRANITDDGHPPLHAVQLMGWARLVGDSVGALRANSALWGSLSLALVAVLVFQTGGDLFCAVVAVGLFALSPLAIGYAQEIRPYALGTTSVCLFAALLLDFLKRGPRSRRGILLALAGIAACFTHYWATMSVFALLCGAWTNARNTETGRRLIWIGIACGAALLCWLPVLLAQIRLTGATNAFWANPPGLKNAVLTFLTYTQLSFRFASNTFVLTSRPVTIAAAVVCYLGAVGVGLWKGPSLLRWWLLLGLGLPFALSFWKPHLYVSYRYTYIVYPAFVLLVAHGLQAIRVRVVQVGMAAFLLVLTASGTHAYFTRWEKANPMSVARYVGERATTRTAVVRPAYFAKLFDFYYRGAGQVIDEDTLDSTAARRAVADRPMIFVAFDVPSDPVGDALLAERRVLSAHAFSGHSHLGVHVYELEKMN
jgi:hypothetical protein